MTKTGIQGVESSPRFLNMGKTTAVTETELLHHIVRRVQARAKYIYFITCHLSNNLQSRPRRQRQTPLINTHSPTLKLYRDYSTHSIFQMQVDFAGVDFLTTTPKYRKKQSEEFALVRPHPLKNFPKHQRVLRRRNITVDDANSELLPVLLAFFLTTCLWPSPTGYLSPLFAETKN